MPVKSSWVTIPDETLHTPVSDVKAPNLKKPAENPSAVKHKAFWGVSFVVVIVSVTALLLPEQFASILQGNLFDTTGTLPTQEQGIPALNVLPAKTAEEKAATAPEDIQVVDTAVPTEAVSAETVTETPVVQPDSEATTVEVEPVVTEVATTETPTPEVTAPEVVTPEPAPQTPIVTTPKTPSVQGQIAQQVADAIKQLQGQQGIDIAAQQELIRQLTQSIQGQTEGLYPAAPEAPLETPAVTPTVTPTVEAPSAIETTTIIATPQGVSTGYRPNTHVVTIQPQYILQQNKLAAQRGQITTAFAQQTIDAASGSYYSQQYAGTLGRATGTPGTGPQESLMIAFLVSFVGLITWKATKIFA